MAEYARVVIFEADERSDRRGGRRDRTAPTARRPASPRGRITVLADRARATCGTLVADLQPCYASQKRSAGRCRRSSFEAHVLPAGSRRQHAPGAPRPRTRCVLERDATPDLASALFGRRAGSGTASATSKERPEAAPNVSS